MMLTGTALIAALCLVAHASAEVAPVVAQTPISQAWIGQRAPFYIELRSPGSFAGTAKFDLPQIPGTLVVKIGDPVVESLKLEGETWFVQRHEFALFAQRTGKLEVPSIGVRFSRREGFTGPVSEIYAQTEALTIEIRQPPGSEQIGYLVTTESLEITETWEPTPGAAEVGAIFKRTVVQRATQLPGMALAAIPTDGPEGIRVYPGPAETNDDLFRGEFTGERREEITYLLQEPGTRTLPALRYVWWNPKTQTLESKTLPAVTIDVAAPPLAQRNEPTTVVGRVWPWLMALVMSVVLWQRRRLLGGCLQVWRRVNPPSRVASRQLLRACRRHDAAAAEVAWVALRKTQGVRFSPGSELRAAVLDMQRAQFGPHSTEPWNGDLLAHTLREDLTASRDREGRQQTSELPWLNPQTKPRQEFVKE